MSGLHHVLRDIGGRLRPTSAVIATPLWVVYILCCLLCLCLVSVQPTPLKPVFGRERKTWYYFVKSCDYWSNKSMFSVFYIIVFVQNSTYYTLALVDAKIHNISMTWNVSHISIDSCIYNKNKAGSIAKYMLYTPKVTRLFLTIRKDPHLLIS